ncbi:MAG: hypothetical protein AAGI51_09045 [Pseudomonadota bacterium]
MAEMIAEGPFGEAVDETAGEETRGGVRIVEAAWRPTASVQPFRGRLAEVEGVLGPLPGPGGASAAALSLALDQWLVEGEAAALAARLQGIAAVTDQSDGWAWLRLSGQGAAAAVSRLADFDPEAPGCAGPFARRTALARCPALVARRAEGAAWELGCPRSYARWFLGAVRRAAAAEGADA